MIFDFNRFDGCIALELGGGVGLCSIVMARVAKRVFCTGKISLLVFSEQN
jgi:protein-L-isoaspartate O-methyltransferase